MTRPVQGSWYFLEKQIRFGLAIFINLVLIGVETSAPCEEARTGFCYWDLVPNSDGTSSSLPAEMTNVVLLALAMARSLLH